MKDYPFSTVIYSKDSYVKQHKRCLFNGKNVRATHDQVIDMEQLKQMFDFNKL